MTVKNLFWIILAMLPTLALVSCEDSDKLTDNSTIINGHNAVDLGLPSGTLWADRNIGSVVDYERGDFFQWGETSPCTRTEENLGWNENYVISDNALLNASDCGTDKDPLYAEGLMSKDANGNWSGSIAGNAKYDAATANWGGTWKMPTEEQCKELYEYCDWEYVSISGYNGYKITGKNGNSIFLPLGGNRHYIYLDSGGSKGYYWTSDINSYLPSTSSYLTFEINKPSGNPMIQKEERFFGFNIRPVYLPANERVTR